MPKSSIHHTTIWKTFFQYITRPLKYFISESLFQTIKNNYLKYISHLNIRNKTIKLSEEILRLKFHDLEFGNVFFDIVTKSMCNKRKKIGKSYFTRIFKMYAPKDIIKKVKNLQNKRNICKSYI